MEIGNYKREGFGATALGMWVNIFLVLLRAKQSVVASVVVRRCISGAWLDEKWCLGVGDMIQILRCVCYVHRLLCCNCGNCDMVEVCISIGLWD